MSKFMPHICRRRRSSSCRRLQRRRGAAIPHPQGEASVQYFLPILFPSTKHKDVDGSDGGGKCEVRGALKFLSHFFLNATRVRAAVLRKPPGAPRPPPPPPSLPPQLASLCGACDWRIITHIVTLTTRCACCAVAQQCTALTAAATVRLLRPAAAL